MAETLADVFERAMNALAGLAALGEEVEDEFQYVTDLSGAYHARLAHVAAERAAEAAMPAVAMAVAAAIEEAKLITDPHRAIDWLSTFPQVVLFAVGESA